jgi:hypothetical protein
LSRDNHPILFKIDRQFFIGGYMKSQLTWQLVLIAF